MRKGQDFQQMLLKLLGTYIEKKMNFDFHAQILTQNGLEIYM